MKKVNEKSYFEIPKGSKILAEKFHGTNYVVIFFPKEMRPKAKGRVKVSR